MSPHNPDAKNLATAYHIHLGDRHYPTHDKKHRYSVPIAPNVEAPMQQHIPRPIGRARYTWAILRMSLGWIFAWAFLDKLLGLGFATPAANAWAAGGSPTAGYLANASGPFAPVFQAMSGSAVVDWLFMIGLLLIGISLLVGVGVRVAAYSGSAMMFLMWLAHLPKENNPLIDEHVIYILALLGLSLVHAGQVWGLGKLWVKLGIVERHPWLE